MYHIKAILLNNCPYSDAALEIIKNNKIKSNIININNDNKYMYKNDQIDTFPQIYLNKNNSYGNLLLGGYDDLKKFIDNFKDHKYSDDKINKFMNEYKWSKKATLRFIQLLHSS